jgi:phosphoribosyl-dephospho-CoA transferase
MKNEAAQARLLQRHSRVWLDRRFASSAVRLVQEDHRAAIETHAARGHPFVARRPQPCDGDVSACVPLGLRLPPDAPFRSLSFCAEPGVIARVEDALPLAQALACDGLPPAWRQALQLLLQRLQDIGMKPLVYGSLAWQSATGSAYLRDDSDIDLLLRPASAEQARACLQILAAASPPGAIRLDGEMEFPDGRAVAWKELTTDAAHMLVKTAAGIALDTTESVWNQADWQ